MPEYWLFRDQLEQLLDPRCYTIEWLDRQIMTGAASVIANDKAIIVFQVKEYPAGAREVHGLCAAGDLAVILELIEQAEDWGRAMGCEFASIASREGWSRVLSDKGYRVHQVELRKEL